jgi:hypothetical protein
MTQIDYIIELFKHLEYEFIDERVIRNSHNELWYHNGNLIIDVNFKFETGEITTIGEKIYSGRDGLPSFRGVMSAYLKRVDQDKLRDFKIKCLL